MLKEIQTTLKKMGDPAVAAAEQKFFKGTLRAHGIKSAAVGKIAREYFPKIDAMEKSDVFDLCEKLMASGYMEEFGIASDFTYRIRKKFDRADFDLFEKWIAEYVDNWAKCDIFCNHTVADLVEKFPDLARRVAGWAKSKNRWVRRAAAVTFILPARHGKFIDTVFAVADELLTDTDDMVQKGYGWALKAASETQPQAVYDFVTARVKRMPRTAFRYAIEKLPADMRKKAMGL